MPINLYIYIYILYYIYLHYKYIYIRSYTLHKIYSFHIILNIIEKNVRSKKFNDICVLFWNTILCKLFYINFMSNI